MELTQLYQFLEVARQGNITHAAQRLYISQPALSKSIKLLEQELGVQLFDRRKNRIILNENGALALRHISAALGELEGMQKELRVAGQKPQLMRFCAQSASSLRFFVSQFNVSHPEIETRSDVVPLDEICPLLLERQYDIAFTFAPSSSPDIHSIPLGLEQILISAPLHHPLVQQQRRLTLRDLNGQDFYLFDYPDSTMAYVDRLLQRAGVSIRRHYERDQMLYNRRVRTTEYLTLSSTLSAKFLDYGPQRVFLTLDAPEMRVTHYINHLPNTAQMAELFVDWLKQNYKALFSFGKTRPSAAKSSHTP